MTEYGELIQQAAHVLRGARHPAVLTGAGVSQESGVPTFREALDGLWAQYDPEELATPMAFQRNPKLVWDWYAHRRALLGAVQPNPAHLALARLEQRFSSLRIITQNVDDLHEQAGSTHIIHLHGNIARSKCVANCQGNPTLIDLTTLDPADDETPPKCPHCGEFVRPDVVWFHEVLPAHAIQDATAAAQRCDVMLVVGTSGLVSPASTLPHLAKQHGATIIEINPAASTISPIADIKLTGPAGLLLPQLVEVLDVEA
ncbi:MAG: NAD-dependent protein deacylase [Anaerolineaceae bacterium]|nr:NAD-dependent protein deacylase [Anaerolineaceae bacterium]